MLREIALRVREVAGDVNGVALMIERQCALWKSDPHMERYLRPATLFGDKFHEYFGQRGLAVLVSGEKTPPIGAVNGRLWQVDKLLKEIGDEPQPDRLFQYLELKQEREELMEKQKKASAQ